jgi:hypothetical protein
MKFISPNKTPPKKKPKNKTKQNKTKRKKKKKGFSVFCIRKLTKKKKQNK